MNNILCSIASTGFNLHANEPAYIAQVDVKNCVTRSDYSAAQIAATNEGGSYAPGDPLRTNVVVLSTCAGPRPRRRQLRGQRRRR